MNPVIEISTDRSRLDRDMIHDFLSNRSYWVKGVSRESTDRSIDNSICFGLYKDGQQLAFARVMTDYSRLAYLLDVFVLEDYRGQGYSKMLLKAIFEYPEFKDVSRWLLATADAHDLYRQFGFKEVPEPQRFMGMTTNTATTNDRPAA